MTLLFLNFILYVPQKIKFINVLVENLIIDYIKEMYVSEKLNSLDSEFGDGFKAAEMSRLRVAVRSNVSIESLYLF